LYPNGDVFKGEFVNDEIEGKDCIFTRKLGGLQFIADWQNNLISGTVKIVKKNKQDLSEKGTVLLKEISMNGSPLMDLRSYNTSDL
jgi:hypothetical protein